jgi:hypothetical protein
MDVGRRAHRAAGVCPTCGSFFPLILFVEECCAGEFDTLEFVGAEEDRILGLKTLTIRGR